MPPTTVPPTTVPPTTVPPTTVPPMMDVPLNSWLMFAHAANHDRHVEIVTRRTDGEVVRTTYGEWAARTQQLMHALDALGLDPGARVASLMWNSQWHLEAYFAVPCTGRVLHTANIRLSDEDLVYMLDHAEDQAVIVDADLLPIVERIHGQLRTLRHVIVVGDVDLSRCRVPGAVAYEDLLSGRPTEYPRRHIDEHTPLGLCYTSGTTGRPKAAEYTHRSTFLHAQAAAAPTAMRIGRGDCVLPQVPMFHANAWGMAHASVLAGAKLVFYAGALDPSDFVDLLHDEEVTISAGVPTVWLTVADELASRGTRPPRLSHVASGGSQPPRALIQRYRDELDIDIVQAWGMTETSPLAALAWPQHRMLGWQPDEVLDAAGVQAGLPLPGVEISVRDEAGNEVPHDGRSMGDLHVRGPWVIAGYFKGDGADAFTDDGWFRTGDVAVVSPEGYFVIVDRTKDLIKSGGEWISSVDMESAIMAMPGVAEAAVIAVADTRWQERPLAAVVVRPGHDVDAAAVREHLARSGFADWQLPDRVEFVPEVPKTAVGKFDKKLLRARFA